MGNIESEKSWTLLEDLIQKAGGCAVIDGGFATQLERHGASINDPLWSALCLIKDSHLVKKVLSLLFFLPVVVFAFLCRSRSWSEIFFLRFIWNTWRPVQIYWSLRLTRLICEFPLSLLGVFYFFFCYFVKCELHLFCFPLYQVPRKNDILYEILGKFCFLVTMIMFEISVKPV